MILKVYLHAVCDSVNSKERKDIYKFVKQCVRSEYSEIRDDDEIKIFDMFDETLAPYEYENKKLYHLSNSFKKMAECEEMFVLQEPWGRQPQTSLGEVQLWIQYTHKQPIIRTKPINWKDFWKKNYEVEEI